MSDSKILRVRQVTDYIGHLGGQVRHPLVGVVDYARLSPVPHSLNNYEVYGVFMHRRLSVDLTYGCGKYDYRGGGTIICVAPGQIGGKADNGERIDLDGWALLFHPDLLRGTALGQAMSGYTFFDYNVSEALHTTPEEYAVLEELMHRIDSEIQGRRDEMQDAIIVGYIGLLLNYCRRFYQRQFVTRKVENVDVLRRFSAVLDQYYLQGEQLSHGLPSVAYCADRLCMSAGYLGDLVRRHTGHSAIGYIHQYVIRQAKSALFAGDTIAHVAYDLGFDYPGHFSRLFKRCEGVSPSEYVRRLRRA